MLLDCMEVVLGSKSADEGVVFVDVVMGGVICVGVLCR